MFRFDKHVFLSASLVIALAVLVCFRFFSDVLLEPGAYLFGPSGDGLKNYFTVAYQVVHGDGWWFNGMLYPYGDHLTFADGQPLLTKILQFFVEPDVSNGQQIIGIMNLLMIGSLVVTAWCVHRLLAWNFVNPWFAVPFSLTIAFLSPQVARFVGHYALGYTFFVPMCWLFIASFSRSKWPWLIAVTTSLIVLGFGFLHPYYLFIFVLFLGAILGWELLINRFKFDRVNQLLPRIFTLIVPLVVFMFMQSMADSYSDRPTSPIGVFSYMATFQSVFVPVSEPFRSLFNSYFFRIFIPGSWEGNAYVGMVATFTAFTSVFVFLKRFLKRKWKVFTHPVLPDALRVAFIPGVLTLLFAMGLFHNLGLNWLSEFVAPLKQFRSLGRVAWIFYYVFTIWVAYHLYVLYRWLGSVKGGKLRYHAVLLVGLCAFLWTLDAIVNIKYNKANIINKVAERSFSNHYLNEWKKAGVNVAEYQAIIPLPLTLVGSEKIGLENGKESLHHAMRGAFSTGLPIVGGAMSRTSYRTTENTAQIVANELIARQILEDLQQDKRMLLLWSYEDLTEEEHRLTQRAKTIFETNEYRLYSIDVQSIAPPNVIPNNQPQSCQYIRPKQADQSNNTLWNEKTFVTNGTAIILDTAFNKADTLLFSFWMKANSDASAFPNRSVLLDGVKSFGGMLGNNPNLLDGWLLVTDTLAATPNQRITYQLQDRPAEISRLMVRSISDTITVSENGEMFINNIPIN